MSILWTIVISCAPALVALITTVMVNRKTLEATRPKTAAETLDMGIDTQNEIMANLRSEVARSRDRANAAEEQAEKLEARIDDLDEALVQVRQQWMESRRRERALSAHNKALADWCARFYAGGHPPGMSPPPKWEDFELDPGKKP